MRASLWLALHLGGAVYFASIIVSGGLYYAGGIARSPLRTKGFCLTSFALMQVDLEGRSLCPSPVSCSNYGSFLVLLLIV